MAATSVVFKPTAQSEINAAFATYEELRQGLGIEFLDELARIEGHLRANPALYQRIDGDVRRAVMRRFPYGLFYVVDDGQVSVLGCLHLHRDPRSHTDLLAR